MAGVFIFLCLVRSGGKSAISNENLPPYVLGRAFAGLACALFFLVPFPFLGRVPPAPRLLSCQTPSIIPSPSVDVSKESLLCGGFSG